MNHTELKNYAPQARRDFIQAVTDRAAFYGVTATKIEPVTVRGDVAIIAGHAFPASVVSKRKKLVDRIERGGFNQTMEALAYTWFNRFVAMRFMELHGYLEHGYRVLSHPDPTKTIPEILELAEHVDLPGLSRETVIDLKLNGNKESELYQMLLLAQCHGLHSAMPFLFEGIDDETELVLPENLLHSDSIIRKLVAASDPKDWQEVEVLGWLYQFYISERKDEVMARKSAVPAEDIPAVTQIFTPHWIVRYLVENSLGRLWLLNRPSSKLREHMPYYIEGEAEAEFLKITKAEEIRLLDPACGSGHMLTYAFDLLFLIYEEEGYVPNEIPALILRHNLYGLEICPRAAQLANLALVFKAREKSRRFIQPGNLVAPRILALQNIRLDEGELRDYIAAVDLGDLFNEPMLGLLHQFEEATTFGSLIQPMLDETGIAYARQTIETKDLGGQLFLHETHAKVMLVLAQAEMLCQRYHAIAANPPYMGFNVQNGRLKAFVKDTFPLGKSDLFSCFMERSLKLAIAAGYISMITQQAWMFLTSFEELRTTLLRQFSVVGMAHNGFGAFGNDFGTVQFTLQNRSLGAGESGSGCFISLRETRDVAEKEQLLLSGQNRFRVRPSDFAKIPGSPIAYWISDQFRAAFDNCVFFEELATPRQGLGTTNNEMFVRPWPEVSFVGIQFGAANRKEAQDSGRKWFPYNKGGDYRRWYGNQEFVVNWLNDGADVKEYIKNKNPNVARSETQYFKSGITWGLITSGAFSCRVLPQGFVFDVGGSSAFPAAQYRELCLGFLNSKLSASLLRCINPTVNTQVGDLKRLPFKKEMLTRADEFAPCVQEMETIARADWDAFEISWNFREQPLLGSGLKGATLEASWRKWEAQCAAAIRQMQELETKNNQLFIEAYGLADELTPEVPEEQITLARADARRDMADFLSYAVGCMMGRYSLDKPGLILAESGHTLEQYLSKVGRPLNQLAFVPDEDGIIPVLDGEWFQGDIVARAHAFLGATFGEATFEANLRFIEESLGKDLRKYFLTDFYKDHLQTYKKRPIYWLFSSGKERAFQALVYLHRYHEGTLSRMRTEYVISLQGKIASRIDQLADDIQKATSTSHRKRMEKERDKMLRQRTELQAFDEKLRHYADQRIQLGLDDGVKVNYAKFGDLLSDVKAITGGSDE